MAGIRRRHLRSRNVMRSMRCAVQNKGITLIENGAWFLRKPIYANVISFDQARALSFVNTNRREASTPASTVDILHCYSNQFLQSMPSAGDQPAAYHFPPKLSQKNAYSAYSVHSAIPKRNRSQKNMNTVYFVFSYSGIVPKERTLN